MEIAGDQVRGGNKHIDFTKNQQRQHREPKSVTPTATRSCQSNPTNETSTVLKVDSEFVNSTVFRSVWAHARRHQIQDSESQHFEKIHKCELTPLTSKKNTTTFNQQHPTATQRHNNPATKHLPKAHRFFRQVIPRGYDKRSEP